MSDLEKMSDESRARKSKMPAWLQPFAVEAKTYSDGTTATGLAPLPERSPSRSLPSWSCADEAAGKPRCARWCCLPGKCLTTYPESTWPRFVEFKFDGNAVDRLCASGGFRALLKSNGIQHLGSNDGTVSIERKDLPRLMKALEVILSALAPNIPPAPSSEPDTCPKCGTDEWDRITNRVAPGEVFNRCARCGNEWEAQ